MIIAATCKRGLAQGRFATVFGLLFLFLGFIDEDFMYVV